MAAVAPLIGGWLVGNVGWPAIFYINLPLALGAILLALRFVAESREARRRPHRLRRRALATGGLGGLTYALTLWSATRHSTDRGADRARRSARACSPPSCGSSTAAATGR